MSERRLIWYEFFAGGGMARLGLGARWECIFANEWCNKKASAYHAYFGPSTELRVADVSKLTLDDLPDRPDLIWASFPCQDLSLAGYGFGLNGKRSGTFKPFWRLTEALIKSGRSPSLIVLENVNGALTSHGGGDFATIVRAFVNSDYWVGALVIDAVRFLPQSRPRLFIIGSRADLPVPPGFTTSAPSEPWHTIALRRSQRRLSASLCKRWVWWNLPIPSIRVEPLSALIEDEPGGVTWHSEAETERILNLMTPLHRQKVEKARKTGGRQIGTIYRRTRPDMVGVMAQRAEVRFDGISGCLRTPVGGSSRQTVIVVEKKRVRTRLLSPREAARLMGVPDSYPLPSKYNDAYHLFGDGVAVPAVRWLEKHLLYPLAVSKSPEDMTNYGNAEERNVQNRWAAY